MKVSTLLFRIALTLSTAAFAGPGQIGSAGNSGASQLVIPQELRQSSIFGAPEIYDMGKIQALFNEAASLSTVDVKNVSIERLSEISAELNIATRSYLKLENSEVVQKILFVNSRVNAMEVSARLQQR